MSDGSLIDTRQIASCRANCAWHFHSISTVCIDLSQNHHPDFLETVENLHISGSIGYGDY